VQRSGLARRVAEVRRGRLSGAVAHLASRSCLNPVFSFYSALPREGRFFLGHAKWRSKSAALYPLSQPFWLQLRISMQQSHTVKGLAIVRRHVNGSKILLVRTAPNSPWILPVTSENETVEDLLTSIQSELMAFASFSRCENIVRRV